MSKISKLLHLSGIKRKWGFFCVNKLFAGTKYFEKKRKILNSLGFQIGKNTKVVGPIECYGKLVVGDNCWIGKNFKVNGNGMVFIGNNCDIAPEVTFQTGGHKIGTAECRAGDGICFSQTVGDGTWIGGRVTVLNDTHIGNSCVIAGCACVTRDVENNSLVGGVPARLIRKLDDDTNAKN